MAQTVLLRLDGIESMINRVEVRDLRLRQEVNEKRVGRGQVRMARQTPAEVAMRSLHVSMFDLEVGLRWAARLLAAIIVSLVVVVLIGEGFDLLKLKGLEPVEMAFFWIACIGMVVAWRWQVIGGALSLGGMILFFIVEFTIRGGLTKAPFLYLMLLPGILFLVDSFISWRRRVRFFMEFLQKESATRETTPGRQ
jgi:hypothetical protein